MANGVSTELIVKRQARGGWFVYTCDQMPGLFVACQDDQVAYNDVPKAIKALMRLDHGIDCVVTHKVSYAEFMQLDILHDKANDAIKNRTDELMGRGVSHIAFAVHNVDGNRTVQ